MLRGYVKGLLFIVSYIPLFVILLIKNTDNHFIVGSMLAIIIVPSVILFLMFRSIKKISGDYFIIESIENVNKIGLEYFVAYIIPFLNFNLGLLYDAISLLILFGFMCFMYIKSDLIYMNPVLNIIGYNIFKIISEKKELMIITKKKRNELNNSEELIELGNNVLLGKVG